MNSDLQNQQEKLYNALCLALSERINQVDWASFTKNDWSIFIKLAEVEGVAPLIHWTFIHEDISDIEIPPTVITHLRTAYYNTIAQNQVMFKELERILGALNQSGIPVIVLKGAALAATVYPDTGLRPMGDLDLLLSRNDITTALNVIDKLGYSYIQHRATSILDWDFEHHVSVNNGSDPKISIELHWNLISGDADWRSPDIQWFWANSTSFQCQTIYNTTSPAELSHEHKKRPYYLTFNALPDILYLCNHQFLQHDESKLIWIYDLNLIIAKHLKQINWDELVTKALEWNWSHAVGLGLQRTRDYFNTPVPRNIFTELQEDSRDNKEQQRTKYQSPKASFVINQFYSIKNPAIRFRYIFSRIFPKPEYIKKRYTPKPSWIWPLFYPYRWLIIARELINTLIH
jgi:hypothetical protein